MKKLFVATLALMIASCAVPQSAPRAQETSRVKVITAGAGMAKSSEPYYFHVGISPKPGATFPIFAVAEFENPENPAKPLISEGRMTKPGDVIALKSPHFRQRPENRIYTVVVRFYRDASRRQKVDELTQQFLPALPSEQDLRRAGLEHLVD